MFKFPHAADLHLDSPMRGLDVQSLTAERDAAIARQSELEQEWKGIWAAGGLSPLPPREMRSWIQKQRSLVDRVAKMRAGRQEAAAIEERIAALRSEIAGHLKSIGEPAPDPAAGLNSLVDRCEALLDSIDAANSEIRTLESNLVKLKGELDEAEREARDADANLQSWQAEWAEAVKELGLEATQLPEVAGVRCSTGFRSSCGRATRRPGWGSASLEYSATRGSFRTKSGNSPAGWRRSWGSFPWNPS